MSDFIKIAYFDAFSGISGDMVIGALLDLGLSLDLLKAEFSKLQLSGYTLHQSERVQHGIRAIKFDVGVSAQQHERSFRSIADMLDTSPLSGMVKTTALKIFTRLAEAEAHVHNTSVEDVHFHEVGAVDSILDIVGAAIGFEALGIQAIYTSPLPMGGGFVSSRHGMLPVPGPATAELVKGLPVRFEDGQSELVTPTGAAILAALAQPRPPLFSIAQVGYGAGERTLSDRPNVLRICLGHPVPEVRREQLLVLETNIDDLNPEWYEHVMEQLFAAGARDVSLSPIHMKKNRPGIFLWVLCDPQDESQLSGILFNETSTLGIRSYAVDRLALRREQKEVQTRYGRVRVKIAHQPNGQVNCAPEYDDCKRLAQEKNIALKRVYEAALQNVQSEYRQDESLTKGDRPEPQQDERGD